MKLTEVSVSRTIPAPADKVFDVWMDPKSPGGPWFGAERLILNPVVDGLFYLAVKHEGRTWPHYGRFLQINRPSLEGRRIHRHRHDGTTRRRNGSHAPSFRCARRRDGTPARGRLDLGFVQAR
jgi:hypothetical protein